MTGELFINGNDAYTTYGASLEDTSLGQLMAPPPMKEIVSNKFRLSHGKVVVNKSPKLDERDVTLALHITAPTEAMFFARYAAFCNMLKAGKVEISTKYQSGVVYRFYYVSCTQFSQFMRGIAKFSLKLNEPDPSNRGTIDKYDNSNA